MNLFQKASANLALTPGERAILKLLQSLLLTALLAGLMASSQYLAGSGPVNWHVLLVAVGGAAALAVAHALAKYYTSQGDTALGTAIDLTADAAAQKAGIAPLQGGTVVGPVQVGSTIPSTTVNSAPTPANAPSPAS